MVDEIDNFADVSYPRKRVQVTVVLRKDKKLDGMIKNYNALETLYAFDEHAIEEKIKKAMKADPRRVKVLSESHEIKAALDKIQRMFS
jgi:formaldehyde-activating enzyme involved in methanogenesis